jgi:phage terminase large subunit-like protein
VGIDRIVGCEVWSGDHDATVEVAAYLDELAEHFTVAEVVFDFWRASALASDFEQRGLTVVSFPQTDSRMIPATARLTAAINDGRLVHPDDPALNQHVANAILVTSRRGSRITRPGSAEEHLDAVVALAMAVDRAEAKAKPEPVRLLGWL